MNTGSGERALCVGAVFAVAMVLRASLAVASSNLTGPVVSFAGALNQDGCPDCCQFSCRQTPTPTPHFDSLGRRVFQRKTGRFLFIVEGAYGESLRPPSVGGTRKGTVIHSLGNFSRPGPQVLFDRPLGDGNPIIECGTTLQGGVPSAVGLNVSQTTNAMIDVACRFEWVNYTEACTRNRFGAFSTISDQTLTQFCFQVPEAAEFPPGDTVVQIQLMDTFGNLGPAEEVVIRVGTAAPTPTPTPTLNNGVTVSGMISHFGGASPVGDVTVEASLGQTSATGAAGGYVLNTFSAPLVAIVPRKNGGLGGAVSPLDAAWILQSTAGMRNLDALQRLACDVTGDGTVSNLDAAEILKQVVGVTAKLPIAGAGMCDSDWAFYPVPAVASNQSIVLPSSAPGSCQRGAIHFEPLQASAAGQSFLAVPYGDCTGNWQAEAGAALAGAGAGHTSARLGRPRVGRSPRLRVPLYVDGKQPFHSIVVDISYDAKLLAPRRARRSVALAGAMMRQNSTEPGRLRLVVASGDAIAADDRPVMMLEFRARRNTRRVGGRIELIAANIDESPS